MKLVAMLFVSLATLAMAGPNAGDIAAYRALAVLDARLATTGYRLASANAPFCKGKLRNPGWVLHSYRQYPDRDIAQAAFAFPSPIAISALVDGGPAEKAGLKVGDGLVDMPGGLWIGGELIRHKPSSELVDNVNGRVRGLLATEGPIELMFERGIEHGENRSIFKLDPPAICASEFWVDSRNKVDAGADGEKVRITSGMMVFAADDQELAAVVAHELAHNLLGHRARLAAIKKAKAKAIMETEVEADRLSVWLMANAGFDPTAALRFNERYGRKYGLGIFSDGTHHRWKKRVEIIQAEIDLINATASTNGRRDPPLLQALRNPQ